MAKVINMLQVDPLAVHLYLAFALDNLFEFEQTRPIYAPLIELKTPNNFLNR